MVAGGERSAPLLLAQAVVVADQAAMINAERMLIVLIPSSPLRVPSPALSLKIGEFAHGSRKEIFRILRPVASRSRRGHRALSVRVFSYFPQAYSGNSYAPRDGPS
jgi:hypothetical protein